MLIIGLTGPSGGGKTTVAALMTYEGIYVVDADEVARIVVEPGKPALDEIVHAYGSGILLADGTLDRKKLAGIVFHDPDKLAQLNEITHKYIAEYIKRDIAEMGEQISAIDAAALVESGLADICDYVITVIADEDVQIERIMERDALTEQEARARIKAQRTRQQYIADADFVIDNSGDEALEVLLRDILRRMGGGARSER